MPRLHLLLLIALCSAVFAADQQPTVLGPTSGLPQNLQPGDRLLLPGVTTGNGVVLDPGAQSGSRVLTVPLMAGPDTLLTTGTASTAAAPEARAFYPQSVYHLAVGDRAHLQSALDTYGAVRLDAADYTAGQTFGYTITLRTGYRIYGPGVIGCKIPALTIAPGSSGIVVSGVGSFADPQTVTFQAGATISNCLFRHTSYVQYYQGTSCNVEGCVWQDCANSQWNFDCSAGGHFSNNRLICTSSQGQSPEVVILGNPANPSIGNQIGDHISLQQANTAAGITLSNARDVSLWLTNYERNNGTSQYAVSLASSVTAARSFSIAGGQNAGSLLNISTPKFLLLYNNTSGGHVASALASTSTLSASFEDISQSINTDAASSPVRFSGYDNSSNATKLGGSTITAVLSGSNSTSFASLMYPARTEAVWALPTWDLPPAEGLGPNYAAQLASLPDSSSYLQGLIDAGIGMPGPGVFKVVTPLRIGDGHGLIGAGEHRTVLVAATTSTDLIQVNPAITGDNQHIVLADLTLQGGANGIHHASGLAARYQFTNMVISHVCFRDMTGSGMFCDQIYAWDGNGVSNCDFVNCAYGVRSYGPSGAGADYIGYVDKLHLYHCRFLACGYGLFFNELNRADNNDAAISCLFADCVTGASHGDQMNEQAFINCIFRNCAGDPSVEVTSGELQVLGCSWDAGRQDGSAFDGSSVQIADSTFTKGSASFANAFSSTYANAHRILMNDTFTDLQSGGSRMNNVQSINTLWGAGDNPTLNVGWAFTTGGTAVQAITAAAAPVPQFLRGAAVPVLLDRAQTVDAQGAAVPFSPKLLSGGGGGGSVTSVAANVPAFMTVTGSPVTGAGTLAFGLSGTALPVANGGTGVTGMSAGQVLIGTGSGATPATLTAGTGVTVTNGSGTITISSTSGSASFVATGSTTSRTQQDRAADVWNVKDFGCVADGTTAGAGTDNATALAAAVTAAHNSYVSSGQMVALNLGNGTYALGSTVTWQSGVILQGPGCLVRAGASTATGALYSLIKGSSLTDIGFRDLTAFGVGPDRKIAGSCTDSATLGARDSFFDFDQCTNLAVQCCQLFRFQNAMLVSQSSVISVKDNYVNDLATKTLAQLDAGTFTLYSFTGDPGGCLRILGERAGVNQTESDHITISGNIFLGVGLDQGIDLASQSGYPIRVVVTGNYVAGSNAGIQIYTSGAAVPDPGTLTTTDRGATIAGNLVQWTYEEGIYIRGVEGVSCTANRVDRCDIIGTLSGSSAGGILERTPTIHTYPTSPVAHDLFNTISGNYVTDCGNPTTGVSDAGIRCDTQRGLVSNNVVARSADRFGANLTVSGSYGICTVDLGGVGGVSDAVHNLDLSHNSIRGYGVGIQMAYVTNRTTSNGAFSCSIQDCHIDTVTTGILLNTLSSGYLVDHCTVQNASSIGIYVKNSPFSRLTRNIIDGAPTGIQLASGSQASDYYQTGGRMGPTLICNDNVINGATTPISINETTTGDTSVRSRCLQCQGNIIDGTLFNRDSVGSFTFTAAPTSSDFRIWHVGDVAPQRTPTAAGPAWVCTSAGAFGASIATTASATSGSPIITFSGLTAVVPDDYLTITGLTGNLHVLSVNVGANQCTVDQNASATVSGATVSHTAPVFSNLVPSTQGGTGVNNAGTLTNANNTTITGGGTLGLGGFTLTVPATGTAALLSANTFTGKQTTAASGTGGAGFNLPHGTAPTSPADGDLWTTTGGFFARVNGATVGPLGVGGVTSLNSLTGALNIVAGSNVSVTPSGSNVTIACTSGVTTGNYTTVADTAYTALGTDAVVAYTSITASRTVTLPAASAFNPGRLLLIKDLSGSLTQSINITIARAGTDTIEGGTASWTIRNAKGWRLVESDGVSNWHLVGMSKDTQFWIGAGTYTWTPEPGAKYGHVELMGGGAGGAGGAQEPSGTASVGGGSGSGAGLTVHDFLVADAGGSTQTVVIGAGGTGGLGATSTGTAGANSTAGGNTTFALNVTGIQAVATGAALSTGGGAGTGGGTGQAGQGTSAGGAGNASPTSGGAGNNAVTTFGGAGGGGAGGGISTAGTPFTNGGHGANGGPFTSGFGSVGTAGNARGSSDGAAGSSPSNVSIAGYVIGAPGGGGGASSILTNGGNGGNGARPGGGGGGGGAALNGHNGGNGGNGGDGAALVSQGL